MIVIPPETCHILPCLAASTVLDDWLTPPHLQHYIPFDPDTSTAYILHPGQYWQTYRPALPRMVRRRQTLFPLTIMVMHPTISSYACIHHWSSTNLILDGHGPFHHTPKTSTDEPSLLRTSSPSNWTKLEQAIRDLSAIGICNGSYMPH